MARGFLEMLTLLAATDFFLRAGDRVVFYGDSITEQQVYTSFVEALVRTRYPGLHVTFHGRGWAGDAAWGGGGGSSEQRVSRDVKPLDPTVITVLLGMNDAGYVPFDPKIYADFDDWYSRLLGFMRKDAPHARYTLIRTCPWDAVTRDLPASYPEGQWAPWSGYNDVLQRFGKVVEDHAAAISALYVDFNQPLLDVLRACNAADRPTAQQIIPDGIHPGPGGALIMAQALMRAWKLDPVVARVHLDAGGKVVEAENAKVEGFDGRSWTETDGSLPFWVEPDNAAVQLVLAHSDFTDSMNREMLRVDGLEPGSYSLLVDGKAVAKFSNADLEVGVNLARFDTPMREQGLKVYELIRQRCDLDFFEWRQVEIAGSDLKTAAAAEQALRAMEAELEKRRLAAAQPKPHHFELRRD